MQASTLSVAKHFRVLDLVCAATLALCLSGCKKSEAPANTSSPAGCSCSARNPASSANRTSAHLLGRRKSGALRLSR